MNVVIVRCLGRFGGFGTTPPDPLFWWCTVISDPPFWEPPLAVPKFGVSPLPLEITLKIAHLGSGPKNEIIQNGGHRIQIEFSDPRFGATTGQMILAWWGEVVLKLKSSQSPTVCISISACCALLWDPYGAGLGGRSLSVAHFR